MDQTISLPRTNESIEVTRPETAVKTNGQQAGRIVRTFTTVEVSQQRQQADSRDLLTQSWCIIGNTDLVRPTTLFLLTFLLY